jgi:hypothetical protein
MRLPEIRNRTAIRRDGEKDSSATRMPRYVVPQKKHVEAKAR